MDTNKIKGDLIVSQRIKTKSGVPMTECGVPMAECEVPKSLFIIYTRICIYMLELLLRRCGGHIQHNFFEHSLLKVFPSLFYFPFLITIIIYSL